MPRTWFFYCGAEIGVGAPGAADGIEEARAGQDGAGRLDVLEIWVESVGEVGGEAVLRNFALEPAGDEIVEADRFRGCA